MTSKKITADLNKQLIEAIARGCIDACQRLLGCGANANAVDNNGWYALHRAAQNGHVDACQCLLEYGANINAVDSIGWSALHWAAWNGHGDACQQLLNHGANVCAVDNDGCSALHRGAQWDHSDICLKLLANGGNPHIKNKENQTAREVAISHGYVSCAHAIDAWVCAQAARAAVWEIRADNASKGILL